MDLSAATRDIYGLVSAFAQLDGMRLHQMKELWKDRGFSFIHEACPKDTTQDFFMQSLYSSALGHIKCIENSFSWRLGGLFVLYCLYETQYVEPYYLIYLSLEDLENLHGLVKELRRIEHAEGLKIVRVMLQKEAFLFGCVSVDQKSIADACEKLAKEAAARLKHARFRLLANVPLQEHVHGDLRQEFCLDAVADLTKEYAAAKHQVLTGLGTLESDAAGIDSTCGDELKEVADHWENLKKEIISPDGVVLRPAIKKPPPQEKKQKRKIQKEEENAEMQEVDSQDEVDLLAEEILGLIDME